MGVNLFLVLLTLCPVAIWSKDFYTAAVFEHRPRGEREEEPRKIVSANLKFYEKATHLASNKGADIIVFNEYGIHPYFTRKEFIENFNEPIPDPKKVTFNPCEEGGQNMPILSTLSCMAKKNNIYLVANMGDIQPCDGSCNADAIDKCDQKCPDDNVLLFNTNVVFDRRGNLIAKYHKNNPYTENVNSPDLEDPDFITFNTDFGTFGLIVCFDSVFETSKILVEEHGVDTILFPTFWFDDILPFNGVEWQQSWAIANKVNFLAANTQTSGNGSLGSGIFSKDHGALVYSYEPDGESKLLIANVPVRDSKILPENFKFNPSVIVIQEEDVYLKAETGDKFPLYGYVKVAGPIKERYSDYRVYKYQTEKYALNKLKTNEGNIRSCSNGFCCQLQYVADSLTEDFYLAAFSGLNDVKNYFHWYEEVCMLLRCDEFEKKPCVLQPSRSKTVFKSLSIAAEFTSERVYPTVTKSRFRLAPKNEWEITKQGSKVTLKFEPRSEEPLLKAALLGRCYERDPPFVPWYQY